MTVEQESVRWKERMERWIERLVCENVETEERRTKKIQFTFFSVFVIPAGLIWALLYYLYGEHTTALIPFSYSVLTLADLLVLIFLHNYEFYRRMQQLFILLLPMFLHMALGGFVASSAVIFWSFLAPLTAMLFGEGKEPLWWFAAYLLDMILVTVFQPNIGIENNLPHGLIVTLFVLNIGTVSTISFVVLNSFVKDRRRLRELEVAYLNQEMVLRQSEKLATLGTLAAGVAHELNNPAAATNRAASQLRYAFNEFESALADLITLSCDEPQREMMVRIADEIWQRVHSHTTLRAIERLSAEVEIDDWLQDFGVSDGGNIAPSLVAAGYGAIKLSELETSVGAEKTKALVRWIVAVYQVYSLLYDIGEGASRVSEIVVALKNYSFLDQAPVQNVNVHEGIENTLFILGSKLKDGITVNREYATDLPLITAYGSELNQVWTNILDNAVYAMNGSGVITIRTRRDGKWVVVEIEDSGHGIPDAIQSRVFDPFFTTKEPGKGTGLGLSTTYGIVTEKHNGSIYLNSQPGRTVFTVRLPIEL